MIKAFIFISLTYTITACTASSSALPTAGRVYREITEIGSVRLSPAKNIEVVAQRINVCDGKAFPPGESSSTGIDSYIVETDSDGYFHLPEKNISNVCSRVVVVGSAISPYLHSVSGRVAKDPVVGNPALYKALRDSDVILTDGAKGKDRVQELATELNQATGSHTVSNTMRSAAISRYFTEICELHKKYPQDSSALYEKANLILGRSCD